MSDPRPLSRAQLRSIDSSPIRDTSLAELDLERVEAHIARAVERGRYDGPTDPLDYLKLRRCIAPVRSKTCVTPAGMLCFGHNPQEIFPHAVVDIGHYRGLEPVSFDVVHLEKNVGGTLFEQIERVEAYLWHQSYHGMTVGEGGKRVELHEYPRVAIRELVVNMLAHRDYSNHRSAARVLKFRNRTEWISPGGLPPGITVESLLSAQASRNPAIVTILYEAGYVEAFGMGLDTVVAVLQQAEMQPPRFEDLRSLFMVTVYGRPTELFTSLEAANRLSDRQRRIITYLTRHHEASPREIADLFDHQVKPRSIQRDIQDLQRAGILTVSGKGPAVRYRLAYEA